MRVWMLFLAVALGACAVRETQITGPYATRLSAIEVEEIKTLTANHMARLPVHPTGPPWRLEVIRPDYIRVDAPILDPGYADTLSFFVTKRQGRWILDGHGENVIVY